MTEPRPSNREQDNPAGTGAPAWYTAEQVLGTVSVHRARRLLHERLASGFRPANDPSRTNVPAGAGHLLLMPSVLGQWAGVKVASVSPKNAERGLPRIQATYVLMDSETLSVRALMDGNALTTLRTPAISAVAADQLAVADASKLVVFGAGPQARSHIEAFAQIRSFSDVVVCGRTRANVDAAVEHARSLGLAARAGEPTEVSDADVVVCTTSSTTPLFDGALVPRKACVVAMGSHEPGARELDSTLMGSAQVVVEDHATAMREAGDVIQAVNEAALDESSLVDLADLVTGEVAPDFDRARVFKCVGMSWQDLAVAIGVVVPESTGGPAA